MIVLFQTEVNDLPAKALLPLFFLAAAHAGWPGFEPVAKTPSRELLPLVNQLCPGHAFAEAGAAGCRVCPAVTMAPFPAEGLQVTGVTLGHFLSGDIETLAMSTKGCEPHANNDGGTALFERQGGQWKMLRYLGGQRTELCRIFSRTDRRDVLLCAFADERWRVESQSLQVVDLADPSKRDVVFGVSDGLDLCQPEGHGAFIQAVSFGVPHGKQVAGISVVVMYGRRRYTRLEIDACNAGTELPVPTMRRYRLDFLWDGRRFREAPWNPETPRDLQSP